MHNTCTSLAHYYRWRNQPWGRGNSSSAWQPERLVIFFWRDMIYLYHVGFFIIIIIGTRTHAWYLHIPHTLLQMVKPTLRARKLKCSMTTRAVSNFFFDTIWYIFIMLGFFYYYYRHTHACIIPAHPSHITTDGETNLEGAETQVQHDNPSG